MTAHQSAARRARHRRLYLWHGRPRDRGLDRPALTAARATAHETADRLGGWTPTAP